MNTERRAGMRTEREKRREGRGCMDVHLPHPILIHRPLTDFIETEPQAPS